MAGNANESLLLATTMENSSAMGKIIDFLKDSGEKDFDQEKARRLFNVWKDLKTNENIKIVRFTRKTLFRADAFDVGYAPIGRPSDVVL